VENSVVLADVEDAVAGKVVDADVGKVVDAAADNS
jgi:hypothetical protein